MRRLAAAPLRVKITVLLVVLLTVGMGVSSLIAATALRGYLLDRVDEQLQAGSRPFSTITTALPPLDPQQPGSPRPPSRFYIGVFYADGTAGPVLGTPDSQTGSTPRVPSPAQLGPLEGAPFTVGSNAGDELWRANVTRLASGDGWVVVAFPIAEIADTVGRLVLLQIIVGTSVVAVAAAIGYAVVRHSLRPLADMSDVAQEIAAGDLSRRVPDARTSSEVTQLAKSFNVMVDRIEESFEAQSASETQARASEEQMRRFVADASHELRTPLTSIRGFAELAGQGATAPETALARIEAESIRMGVLVDDLLLLARLDQHRPLARASVDLVDIVTSAVEGARVHVPDRTIDLVVADEESWPVIEGDAERLRQVVDNLLVNALRHSDSDAEVSVDVRPAGGGVGIAVANTGAGLPPDVADRVFDRFYQADPARTRSAGGAGLGLPIARAIVEAHGGSIELETDVDRGTTFRVLLPAHRRDAARSGADVGGQVLAGERGASSDEVGRRALEDDLPAIVARTGAEVDDPVGVRHDRLVVLDDDDRRA